MLLGLIRPTDGTAEVLGHSISNPRRYLSKIGALIESPAFQSGLSGEANLRVLATLGGHPRKRIDMVLETVGLSSRSRDRVRDYSLGMKQRLGIAAALLPDPELLVLDEPTNGLDPAGIVEIRTLLTRIGTEGKTVFVSSHLLSEVQAEADRLIMITEGRLVYAGDLRDLLEQASECLIARPELSKDLDSLSTLIKGKGYEVNLDGDTVLASAPLAWAPELNRMASASNITLRELGPKVESLEDVFLRLTTKMEEEDR